VIICVSCAIKAFLDDEGLYKNTIVIYNSIDPVKFREGITVNASDVKNQLGVKPDEPMIGIVGNFQEWKGQLTVIRAMDILRRDYPDLVCLLIGSVSKFQEEDIRYFEALKTEINCRGLKNNVIMTGYRSDVANLINALDILVHASIAPEPFGRVVLEGMSLAKPVIATNMGGPKEIIEDGVSGILVPPKDPAALASQIDFLLRNSKVRTTIGINGLQRVNERFNIDTFSVNMSNVYSGMFGDKM
jgi:glycosyltransferase involved in cell wall biosynthesis